jgi:predicted nuclease with TOPRIM domain
MEGNTPIDALLDERRHLTARIEREREQLHRLRIVVTNLEESVARAEAALGEVDSLLGRNQGLRAA